MGNYDYNTWRDMSDNGGHTVRADRVGNSFQYVFFNWKNAEIRYYKDGRGLVRNTGRRPYQRTVLAVEEQPFVHGLRPDTTWRNVFNVNTNTGRLDVHSTRHLLDNFWMQVNPQLAAPVVDPHYGAAITTRKDSWDEIKQLCRAVILSDPDFMGGRKPRVKPAWNALDGLTIETATDWTNFKIHGAYTANPRIAYLTNLIMAVNYPRAWGNIFRGNVRLQRSGDRIPFKIELKTIELRQAPGREVTLANRVLQDWIKTVSFKPGEMVPMLREPVLYE